MTETSYQRRVSSFIMWRSGEDLKNRADFSGEKKKSTMKISGPYIFENTGKKH